MRGLWFTGTFALGACVLLGAQSENPPMSGFDIEGSDPAAIAVADEVMEQLGGRRAWDETRYLTWNFFGRRTHVWDKHTGNLRFESDDMLVLMNLNSKKGHVFVDGQEVTEPAALEEALAKTEGAWINDAYWVFMPYKLKDSGVTLKYFGKGVTSNGSAADVLELTFKDVGRTPENKYHVYVDESSRLVTQWDYYPQASDPEPRFQIPWQDWQKQGGIMLSADRGERKHENVAVLVAVPASVFESAAPVNIMDYRR